MLAKNCDQQRSIAASDINKFFESREVVRIEHRINFPSVITRHHLVEDSTALRIAAEIFKDRHSKSLNKSDATALYNVQELGPGLIQLAAVKSCVGALPA